MKRKITAIMLAIIMTVALFPALPVYAAATTITPGGGDQSGTGWTWVAGTRTLTLSGSADIPADEITFSGAFGTGYITIYDTHTGTAPTINFNDFSITGSAVGAPAYGSAIHIPNNSGAHPIKFNFTGTNTIRGMSNSTTSGGTAIRKMSDGSLTINGAVDLIGGNSTRTDADNDASGGYGIFNFSGDVTINATGPVNITGGDGNGGCAGSGIYAVGYEVTINGTSAVNITGGDKTGNNNLFNGSGIMSTKVTLNNPNTMIHGGDCYGASSAAQMGIYAVGTVTINDSVTITGGNYNCTGSNGAGEGIVCRGLIDITGSGQVRISGGNSTDTAGNGGNGIKLRDVGSLNISNPNTIITGGNGSGSGTNLGFAGSAVYINNATQTITLPYSNISNLVAGTGNTSGSKIFIGTNYFNQTTGKYNTLAEMKTNPTQIIFTGTVPTAPDAPTAVTATAGNRQASVNFTAPSSDGGSPVTSYTVTSSPGGKTATGAASPVLVTGLTNGTAYTFTVTATNDVGTGISSAASSPVIPVKPVTSITGMPTTGTVGTEVDLTSATVNPSDATNKTIVWSVKDADTTGVVTADLTSGKFTPGTAGTLVLTATIVDGETASTNYTQDFTITFSTSGTKIYTISADTALINFGSLTTGYGSAPTSRTVTITNTGNQTITLTEPATTNASSNYIIGLLSDTTLDAGETATFTLQAKTGLAVGTYNETIQIAGTDSAATSVSVQFSVTATSGGSGSGGSHGGGSNNSGVVSGTTTGTDATIKVNGQSETAGTQDTSKIGDQTVTTVTLDDQKIQEKINAEGKNSIVSIPISGSSDIGEGVLNGQTVKDMEKKESVLEIKTNSTTYSLPASEIDIDSVSSKFGQSVELKDIKISIKIAEPSTDTTKIVEDTADKNSYQIVVKPVEFEITCTSGSKTVEVSKFNGYVERTVAIPDGIDPSKVTTGVVLNADETFSHVPTTIVKINGKYYAKINSLTNSTYSVIYNPVEFADVAKHWAKESIDNMGSRLVIGGVGENKFEPNRDITRAEFAAIIVRALGLAPDETKNTFSDVADSKWYSGYVGTAASYGIISGYDADTFAPKANITREQAMAMVARAMALTGLDSTTASIDTSSPLAGYADMTKISGYAKAGIIACLNTGVVTGKTASTIAPKANITRAEVAVIIERLLQKSELI